MSWRSLKSTSFSAACLHVIELYQFKSNYISAVCAEDWDALSPLNFLDFDDEMASQLKACQDLF